MKNNTGFALAGILISLISITLVIGIGFYVKSKLDEYNSSGQSASTVPTPQVDEEIVYKLTDTKNTYKLPAGLDKSGRLVSVNSIKLARGAYADRIAEMIAKIQGVGEDAPELNILVEDFTIKNTLKTGEYLKEALVNENFEFVDGRPNVGQYMYLKAHACTDKGESGGIAIRPTNSPRNFVVVVKLDDNLYHCQDNL